MTAPRRVIPGSIHLLSRRCSERRFFLRPSAEVNAIFGYLLAVASNRYGVVLHALCVLSNHVHIVLSDPLANLPAFERYLDSLVARSINALHGRWESFWASGSYSAVELVSPADAISKIAYVLTNPVAAGLVRRGSDWPGLRSNPPQIGAEGLLFKRPHHFFRPEGPMPETALLEFICPPGFESVDAFRRHLVEEVTALEDEAARELASQGRPFLAVRRLLAQRPEDRPAPGEPRRGLNPPRRLPRQMESVALHLLLAGSANE